MEGTKATDPRIGAKDGEGGSGDSVQAGLSCFIEHHLGVELVGHSGDQNAGGPRGRLTPTYGTPSSEK